MRSFLFSFIVAKTTSEKQSAERLHTVILTLGVPTMDNGLEALSASGIKVSLDDKVTSHTSINMMSLA